MKIFFQRILSTKSRRIHQPVIERQQGEVEAALYFAAVKIQAMRLVT